MRRILAIAACAVIAFSLCGCASQDDAPKQAPSEEQEAPASSQKNAVDKSSLRKELNSQGQYQEADYPKDAWDRYRAALENAYAVNADDDASQEEVDSAKYSLDGSEDSLLNATSREHPKKFDYDQYKAGYLDARDGAWVAAACMVWKTFQSDGEQYLVATIANDDATLSEHDVLLRATGEAPLDDVVEGDVLAILGTTDEMLQVTLGKNYKEWLPTINVVQADVAP